ncbi:MAG: PHP domain-containing protein [Eubacterium sp.]|nr:PHP domain-containing protein [Eubacterium sp.]
MTYRMLFDYHTHTEYSHGRFWPHGRGTVAESAAAAAACGLKGLAISDHGPGHLLYGIKREKFADQRRDIEAAKLAYPGLEIYMSVEANIMDTENGLDLTAEDKKAFDFINAGYHYGVKGGHCTANFVADAGMVSKTKLRNTMTDLYVRALYENDIKILTHPGDKGPVDMAVVAKVCAKRGTWMEISNWHTHLTTAEIKTAMKEDVLFVISSDAHVSSRIGTFERGLSRALEAGLDPERIVNIARE